MWKRFKRWLFGPTFEERMAEIEKAREAERVQNEAWRARYAADARMAAQRITNPQPPAVPRVLARTTPPAYRKPKPIIPDPSRPQVQRVPDDDGTGSFLAGAIAGVVVDEVVRSISSGGESSSSGSSWASGGDSGGGGASGSFN